MLAAKKAEKLLEQVLDGVGVMCKVIARPDYDDEDGRISISVEVPGVDCQVAEAGSGLRDVDMMKVDKKKVRAWLLDRGVPIHDKVSNGNFFYIEGWVVSSVSHWKKGLEARKKRAEEDGGRGGPERVVLEGLGDVIREAREAHDRGDLVRGPDLQGRPDKSEYVRGEPER